MYNMKYSTLCCIIIMKCCTLSGVTNMRHHTCCTLKTLKTLFWNLHHCMICAWWCSEKMLCINKGPLHLASFDCIWPCLPHVQRVTKSKPRSWAAHLLTLVGYLAAFVQTRSTNFLVLFCTFPPFFHTYSIFFTIPKFSTYYIHSQILKSEDIRRVAHSPNAEVRHMM